MELEVHLRLASSGLARFIGDLPFFSPLSGCLETQNLISLGCVTTGRVFVASVFVIAAETCRYAASSATQFGAMAEPGNGCRTAAGGGP